MLWLLKLSDIVDAVTRRIGRAVSWLILACVLESALTATLRYLLDWGSNALLDAQWYMFGLVFLLCSPWTLQEDGHVRVDILYTHLSARVRVGIDILGGLLFLLPVCLLIAYNAWDYALLSYRQGELSPNPGGLPVWPMKLLIPIAFVILAAQGVSEVVKGVAALTGHRPLPKAKAGH